jgi:DNA-binding NarL/FixJ family response regulator
VHPAAVDHLRSQLTARQRDVFDLLLEGLQTKEVASQLKLSPRTVEVHRSNILERFNVTSFAQLLRQMLLTRDS